ncbi:MAG: choice-of-anchor J domain-containing protein [Bacteroidales bacterium]|nr:choice-of-anchor J domain-containing protein [Bacteroidales bacterium]HOI31666.1 choice-of-anchor J domain-containing protein [Bacteroidales bacterium]
MQNSKKIILISMLALIIGFVSSCVKKEFDTPPISNLPIGTVYSIGELYEMYDNGGATQFSEDASVYAIVSMDEASGNIYKSAYIQDKTHAINLRLKETSGLRAGDSIRVYLKNIILSEYNGLMQLDNVQADSNIIILANQKHLTPEIVTIEQIESGNFNAKLIQLQDVQFIAGDTALPFAETDATTNRNLEDCDGNSIVVRTSNYANFANKSLPNGKGSLIAIAAVYSGTYQLYIRSLTEVQMNDTRCGGGGGGGDAVDGVNENFESSGNNQDISLTGWTNIAEAGNRKWQGKEFSGNTYAQATGYNSGLSSMISWLITPNVKMDQQKYLRFKTAKSFWEHSSNTPLTVWASTNYDGSNVATASWTQINATLAVQGDADNAWIESGDIDLSEFMTGQTVAIAFKYVGSDLESTSMRIDDVYIGTETGGGGGGGDVVESIEENFEQAVDYQDINFNGWVNLAEEGNRKWQGKDFSGNKYAQATGYNSGLSSMITWLVTPNVNFAQQRYLRFKTAKAYWEHTSGQPLMVYASTDYDGSNVSTATWIQLDARLAEQADADNAWVESGDIDLSALFSGSKIAIAFKYTGSGTESTTIRIDDLYVGSQPEGGGGGGDVLESLDETFEGITNNQDVNFEGWLNIAEAGNRKWQGKTFDAEKYVQATGYNSGLASMVTWLITPNVNFTEQRYLRFLTSMAYWEHTSSEPLTVYASTDYDGSNWESATWVPIEDVRLAGAGDADHAWIESGNIDLSALFTGTKIAIAFKYVGSGTESTSIRIDDIYVGNSR